MNRRRRKKLWMGKRKLHVSDSVSQCLKCFSCPTVPGGALSEQGQTLSHKTPSWLFIALKDKSEGTSSPRPDQTCIIILERWRRTDVERRKRWVVVVQLRLILRSYQPTPAPDPKPRCPKQAWQWDNRAAERNTVFLPLQPLRSNRQNFHAQKSRPQTSLSNAGLVDV